MTLSFNFILQPTYYKQGFFNVSVSYQQNFGNDNEVVNIICGENEIKGLINRRCNQTYAPRILGRKKLKEWFQENFEQGENVLVTIISSNIIKLSKT